MDKQPLIEAGCVQMDTNDECDDNLVNLIETLQEIDATKPTAKLNEISMIANNGDRIYF